MAVRFPASIDQIDLDAAATGFSAIYTNGGVFEIRPRLAVPGSELNNVDRLAAGADKTPAELAGKPACLELEFVRRPQRKKKRALMHAGSVEDCSVARAVRRNCHVWGDIPSCMATASVANQKVS